MYIFLQEGQEPSKTALLSKEYFVSTHSEGRFATLSNIFPLKPGGPTGLAKSDKSKKNKHFIFLNL